MKNRHDSIGKFDIRTGRKEKKEKVRKREEREVGAVGGRRWLTAAVRGFSASYRPIGLSRERERERTLGGGARDLPDRRRLRREDLGGRRADADGLRTVERAKPLLFRNKRPSISIFYFFSFQTYEVCNLIANLRDF